MAMKNVLGRGVGALLPEEANEEAEKYFFCDIEKIAPNPHQPRSYFDEEKLQQLAESIREKGIIQPLLITKGRGHLYNLIAGERRLRAAKMANLDEVPVVLMEKSSDNNNLELALIENIQRHDLNPIEEANAYSRLIDDFHLTQDEVAKKVGKQRSTITNVLRLLALPSSLQDDVAQGLVTEGHARVLLRVKEYPEKLKEIRDKIVAEGLSVRAAERLCTKNPGKNTAQSPEKQALATESQLPPAYSAALITQLTNHLHTKVRIVQQGSRGKVEIDYYSSDDLNRLVSLLIGE